MNLDQIHDILGQADPNAWHRRWEGGPSFHYELSAWQGHNERWVEVEQHRLWAVYRGDVNLTLAWGLDPDGSRGGDLHFDWAANFIDSKVSAFYADVFWAGALIDRFRVYYIDGGHFLAPHHHAVARNEHGEVTAWESRITTWEVEFGELLSLLERGSSSYEYISRAGLKVVEGGAVHQRG